MLMLRAKLGVKVTKKNVWTVQLDILTWSHGLHLLINKPSCLLVSPSSCIHLIFTTQSNLVMGSGVPHFLCLNCHHQLDLSIIIINMEQYGTTTQKNQFYKRLIWSNKTLLYINQLTVLQEELAFLIEKSKNKIRSSMIKPPAVKLTGQYLKHF